MAKTCQISPSSLTSIGKAPLLVQSAGINSLYLHATLKLLMRKNFGLMLFFLIFCFGCVTWADGPDRTQNKKGPEIGVASWYGGKFHGRMTSNGEIYDMYAHTAAHKTLPFNTVVRVTDIATSMATEVRINDRGPFVKGRIIDLSLAAARDINMVGPGTSTVRIDIIKTGDRPPIYIVQVGAFGDSANAISLQKRLQGLGFNAVLWKSEKITRVIIPELSISSSTDTLKLLKAKGFPDSMRRIQK